MMQYNIVAYEEGKIARLSGSFENADSCPYLHGTTDRVSWLSGFALSCIEMGQQKYGTTLQANNGRDVLMDAYQEAIDLVMYLRQAIAERDGK